MTLKYLISLPVSLLLALVLNAGVMAEEQKETVPANIKSLDALLQQVKTNGLKDNEIYKAREKQFIDNRNQQKQLLKQAKQELRQVKNQTQRLKNTFDDNEEELAELEAELRKSMGNLGEMFGVVRQVSQDEIAIKEASVLSMLLKDEKGVLEKLAQSKALPDISELESLWVQLQTHMTEQGRINKQPLTYTDESGIKQNAQVANLGPFVVFNKDGFLTFDSETQSLLELNNQPSEAGAIDEFWNGAGFLEIAIDPTRGTLLSLSSESPSILDRIQQGGFVGYVILLIAALGLVYAVFLLVQYIQTQNNVAAQLKQPSNINLNNPLGRVLAVSEGFKNKDTDLETLEMQLDEAVLKEMPKLEQGLPLIKLLAAVAPLLGLLGTVTGMIATFQSITLFGTGDPKLMAGGISQALITTVLGLVTAIPLLFMHNILSSRSKSLIQILDQQSAGIIAQQAQKGE